MKANYTVASAKAKLICCGMRFEGKKIIGQQPGIGGYGAIDFLKRHGYYTVLEIPKVVKDRIVSSKAYSS